MALAYDSLQALIQKKYIPVLYDNIFKRTHPLLKILRDKAKTYQDRKIVVPLEYADSSSNVQATSKYQTLTITPVDPFTAAEFTPKMITGTLLISKEEELVMNSPRAVKNILDSKMKNLKKSLEKYFSSILWQRSSSWSSKEWAGLDMLVSSTYTPIGGIEIADFSGWKSKSIDAKVDLNGGSAITESDLLTTTKSVYIKKVLSRGIAKAKALTGENPDLIVVPQYLWDVIEWVLDPQKTGSKMSERFGKMGFDALKYRKSVIIADDDMVGKQSDSNDGRMYFLNTQYLYMFFNPGAKFTVGKFVEAANVNARSAKVHAYGDLVISNRAAHCVITNMYSPTDYIT